MNSITTVLCSAACGFILAWRFNRAGKDAHSANILRKDNDRAGPPRTLRKVRNAVRETAAHDSND